MPRTALLCSSAVLLGCTNDINFTRQPDSIEVVQGNASMLLEPDTVDLWGLTPTYTVSQVLTVNNVGENNLVVYEARLISSGDGAFYVPLEWQDSEHTIAPGQSLELIVAATLAEEGTADGSLRIKSNDVNLLERFVILRATTDPEVTDTTTGDTGATTGDTGGGTADTGA